MFFDARAVKQLSPGNHQLVDGCEGLRLVATASSQLNQILDIEDRRHPVAP